MMIRKTVSLDESVMGELESSGLLEECKNFSNVVNRALKELLETSKKARYQKAILEAKNDPKFQEDVREVMDDFKYADGEISGAV